MSTEEIKIELEQIIDSKGVNGVIDICADICFEKADHALVHWQDKYLAKRWNKVGMKLQSYKKAIETLSYPGM